MSSACTYTLANRILQSDSQDNLRLFQNLWLPSVKLVKKTRVGSWARRQCDVPQTPFERVRVCPDADLLRARLGRSSATGAERRSRLKKPSTASVM